MDATPLNYVYQVVAVSGTGVVQLQPVFAERRQAQRNADALKENNKADTFVVIRLIVQWPQRSVN